MKKIFLLLTVVLLGAASCTKNFFVYENIPSKVYFRNSGAVSVLFTAESYDAVVVKGGYTGDSPVVEVNVSEVLIAEYNAKMGTDYKMLPDTAYVFKAGKATVDASSCVCHYPVEFNCSGLSSGQWMLPLLLTSGDVAVNEDKNTLLLTFDIL